MHIQLTRKQQKQALTPRVQTQTRKHGRTPRVIPSGLPMEQQGKSKPGRPPGVVPSKVPIVTEDNIIM